MGKKRKSKKKLQKQRRKFINRILTLMVLAIVALGLDWNTIQESTDWELIPQIINHLLGEEAASGVSATYEELAYLEFDGENQVIFVYDNVAGFTDDELSLANGSWQAFSDLDSYNRVGVANAMLSQELMPTEPRESLYVDPTGWKNRRVTIGDRNDWLYNRCHLIGFQLTGENNNLKNLMTGTRSLNTPHMLKYENIVASYIKETNHHVRYRVEPIFRGSELVARGVHMQAQSIEDDEINFNIFIFNVEEGVMIDYSDGSSILVPKS